MADTTIAEKTGVHRENRKKNRGRKVDPNQAMAVAKFIRVPPRKARLVMDEVRGKYAIEALAFLRFIPNRAAGYISKVLASAVANAANNHGLNPQNLKLIEARVDEGPRLKRVHPRAQGRAYRILKRMSHITVIVQEVGPKPRKPAPQTGNRARAARQVRQAHTGTPTSPTPFPPAESAEEAAEIMIGTENTAQDVAENTATTAAENTAPTTMAEETAPATESAETTGETEAQAEVTPDTDAEVNANTTNEGGASNA